MPCHVCPWDFLEREGVSSLVNDNTLSTMHVNTSFTCSMGNKHKTHSVLLLRSRLMSFILASIISFYRQFQDSLVFLDQLGLRISVREASA